MNILAIADPASHDLKWIESLSLEHDYFVFLRNAHYRKYTKEQLRELETKWDIKIIGGIEDFSLLKLITTWKSISMILAAIKRFNVGLLHLMYAEPNALWAIFRKKLKIPVIITTRGTDILKTIPLFYNSNSYFKKTIFYLYKKAFRQADVITCTSLSQKQKVLELFGCPEEKVVTIRTGVNYEKIEAGLTIEANIELAGKKYVFFPRSMRPLYNHEFSIRSVSLLPETILAKYYFVFVGRDNGDPAYVESVNALMNSNSHCKFIFLNHQTETEIFSLYKYSDLVVMNPLSDGTPVSAFEAIAFRKPVILGPIDYDQALFKDTVFKLKSWSEDELANLIKDVLEKNIKYDAEEIYKKVYKETNRNFQMKKLLSIYKNLSKKIDAEIS